MSRLLRKVLIYRPVLSTMGKVKKGDLFKMLPANRSDKECPRNILYASTKARKYPEAKKGQFEVIAYFLKKHSDEKDPTNV